MAVPPFEVTVPEGSRIRTASAFVAGAPCDHHYFDVDAATLSGFPPETVMISVVVSWAAGGDAEYYWATDGTPAP